MQLMSPRQSRKHLLRLGSLLALACAAVACDGAEDGPPLRLHVPAGATGRMAPSMVTVSSIFASGSAPAASLSVMELLPDVNSSFLTMTVRQGDAVPMGGGLLPVIAIEQGPAAGVTIERTPVRSAFQLASQSLALAPGAVARFVPPVGAPAPDASAEVVSISPREPSPVRVTFHGWPSGLDQAAVPPGQVTTVEVVDGADLVVAGRSYRLLSADPGSPEENVGSLVELSPFPNR